MTKPPIIIVVAAIVVTMISSSIISMTNAQQSQTSGSKFGTIASLQYGRVRYKYPGLKVLWILSLRMVYLDVSTFHEVEQLLLKLFGHLI
ncbi:MAG: hypothetical protein WBE68_21635 [Candidatus Nitrosopolaris sp.]